MLGISKMKIVSLLVIVLAGLNSYAVDSSGRNSHFWVTICPEDFNKPSWEKTVVTFANGYRSVTSESPLLSYKTVEEGAGRVYQITWVGNNIVDDSKADTLQLNLFIQPGLSPEVTIQSIKVNGADPRSKGLEVERETSKFKARFIDGERPKKKYYEFRTSIVLRDRTLKSEDLNHPFSDLRDGHAMGPTPYEPTTKEKLKAFPKFSWDKLPRGMLVRKKTAYTDEEVNAIAETYDMVVLEKANAAGFENTMQGMLDVSKRLKKINPDIIIFFYWNSRIYYGHYGIDDAIEQHMDEWINKDFVIRDICKTYHRDNPEFLKWWVGCCEKMMAHSSIDGTFVDKEGVPIYMLDALYKATPNNKLVINNNHGKRERIGYVDGTYREGWMATGEAEGIAKTLATARETGSNQKIQIMRAVPKGTTSEEEMEHKLDPELVFYLLYASEYSYFYWAQSVDATKKRAYWLTDYIDQGKRPLGKPFSKYIRDNKVYTRSFEHCDVYLDMRSGTDKFRWTIRIMWKNDIGKPAKPGSSISYTDDTYTIKGSGSFAHKMDQFYYLSDSHYGDGEVQARIDSLDKASATAKAGVMFRESLAADAKMVAVIRGTSGKMYMISRSETGGKLIAAGGGMKGSKPYAKIVRKGDVFRGYYSSDGKIWDTIADVTVPMAKKIEMGMAVASQSAALSTATFSGFSRLEPSVVLLDINELNALKEKNSKASR